MQIKLFSTTSWKYCPVSLNVLILTRTWKVIRWHVLWWRLYAFLSRKFPNQLLNLKRKGHISENIYHEIRKTAFLNLTSHWKPCDPSKILHPHLPLFTGNNWWLLPCLAVIFLSDFLCCLFKVFYDNIFAANCTTE